MEPESNGCCDLVELKYAAPRPPEGHARSHGDAGQVGGTALMPSPEDFDAVLAVIAADEGSVENGCSSDTIVAATGLSNPEVAEVLEVLWRSTRIEGIPTLGDVRPHLRGIRRVLPGRERMWGLRGYFAESPGM
jgi:hypothetical protein